jgi:hypothetical protein
MKNAHRRKAVFAYVHALLAAIAAAIPAPEFEPLPDDQLLFLAMALLYLGLGVHNEELWRRMR